MKAEQLIGWHKRTVPLGTMNNVQEMKKNPGFLTATSIVVGCVIGAGNGFFMSGSWVAYQLAANKTLPGSGALSRLNANRVSANATILFGFLACLYSLSGEFDLLTDLGVFSCSFETAPVTIKVPSKSSSTKVSVSGEAEAGSEITLYDNERPVGYTVAQKNGRWNLTFDLVRPHQYSVHDIYAVASNPEFHMDTRTNVSRLLYNNSVALFPVVTMINYCGVEYRTVFDFLHPAKKLPQYTYSASNPKFTFLVRFDRQTAQKMKEVYVVTTDSVGDKTYVSCTYDQISGDWIATHDYDKTFKLKKGKTYYVRLRTYKAVSGGELYSDWSTVKKVKIKK